MTRCEKTGAEFDIVHLIYSSWAINSGNRSEFEHDIADVLDRSHTHNALHDITGALMTDGRMFAHVVEGPSAAVRALYSRIVHDTRHDSVLTLQHVVVHVRLFDAWPVAFLRVGTLHRLAALDAQSTPAELAKASVSVLKAARPILLR